MDNFKTSYSDIWKNIPNYDWCKIGVNIPILEGEKALQTAPIGDLKEMEIDKMKLGIAPSWAFR